MHDLSRYTEIIQNGGLVAFPTETVYGLGADAMNPAAVAKVFEQKGRPSDNPLIVHVAGRDQLDTFAAQISEDAEKLIEAFWPGPLTLILPKKPEVPDAVTSGLYTVALRMPDHPVALQFITEAGALVGPSANTSGKPSPTKAGHVRKDFGTEFPVLDGGATRIGLESTVLDLSGSVPVILRPGAVSAEDILRATGIEVLPFTQEETTDQPKSPGQKYSHYKPEAEVFYNDFTSFDDENLYLIQKGPASTRNIINYAGNLQQLSKELYDRFRQADHEGYEAVIIQPLDSHLRTDHPGLYDALLNRIRKAAAL